ncbi:MAG: MoxR family ATPase [Clostridia bacterium]|nr:MoxR family ATPase [Clostridia bacterium]
MRPELEAVAQEIEKVIAGKREAIEKLLTALLAGGHVLLDDVPGVGKTTLAAALGRAVGLSCRRIQFTPDVLPSDIVGFSMYDRERGDFTYRPGMLHGANLVLGDEINRASSKTQSALLEAMEEGQVTVDGNTYPLADPFLVVATQNSVGAAGTQLLPYAQMDRFLMRLRLGYPDFAAQMAMLRARQNAQPMEQVACVLRLEALRAMQQEARAVTAREPILDYITRLAMASREHPALQIGISPRGALFLDRAAKARACLEGRDYVTGTDVQAVFCDVCAHRVLLSEEAQAAGTGTEQVLRGLLKTVQSPDRHSPLGGILKK